jgi:hypothetical protein
MMQAVFQDRASDRVRRFGARSGSSLSRWRDGYLLHPRMPRHRTNQPIVLAQGAELPAKVTFDNGSILNVVDRGGGKMHQEGLTANGQKSDAVTCRGLFLLAFGSPPARIEHVWNQDLASFFPIKVNDKISADATPKIADVSLGPGYYAVGYFIDMSVMGIESVRIGECDYPVFKIDLHWRRGGGPGAATYYYHQASMLTLRIVTMAPATAIAPALAMSARESPEALERLKHQESKLRRSGKLLSLPKSHFAGPRKGTSHPERSLAKQAPVL